MSRYITVESEVCIDDYVEEWIIDNPERALEILTGNDPDINIGVDKVIEMIKNLRAYHSTEFEVLWAPKLKEAIDELL